MNVVGATHAFERWLASEVSVVRSDLTLKHRAMAESPFAFFRATFYLWLLRWAEAAGDLAAAPALLGVGDSTSRTTARGGIARAASSGE